MVAWAVPLGVAVISSYLALLGRQTSTFLPGACQRVDVHLSSHIVGQDLAIGQLVDAVCTHLSNPNPRKPLIISSHGPPGR